MNFKIACVVCYIVAAGMISSLLGEVNSHSIRCGIEYDAFPACFPNKADRECVVPRDGYLYYLEDPNAFENVETSERVFLSRLKSLVYGDVLVQYGRRKAGNVDACYVKGISFAERGELGEKSSLIYPEDYEIPPFTNKTRNIRLFDLFSKQPTLCYLELYQFAIAPKEFERIKTLENIEYLGLPFNATDEHLRAITGLRKLYYLNGHNTIITSNGLNYLLELPELTILDLRNVKLDYGGLGVLQKSASLKTLLLAYTDIKDDDLEAVARIKSLEHLELHATGITDRGLEYLAQLPHLRYVSLYRTKTTATGLADFRNKLPEKARVVDTFEPLRKGYGVYDVLGMLGNKAMYKELLYIFHPQPKDKTSGDMMLFYKYWMISTNNAETTLDKIRSKLSTEQFALLKKEVRVHDYAGELLKKYIRYEPISWEQQPLYQYIIEDDKDVEHPIVFEEAAK